MESSLTGCPDPAKASQQVEPPAESTVPSYDDRSLDLLFLGPPRSSDGRFHGRDSGFRGPYRNVERTTMCELWSVCLVHPHGHLSHDIAMI